MTRSLPADEAPTPAGAARDQWAFLVLAAATGVALLIVPGWRSAAAVWRAIGALWLLGIAIAAWSSRRAARGWLVSRIGVQNVAIQALVALPSIAVGLVRLGREPGAEMSAAFVSNALVTVVTLPLLSAVVLTCAALVVGVPLHMVLRRVAAAMAVGACLLAAGTPVAAASVGPQTACGTGAAVELDHVPIAVRDLDRAGRLFRRLGFSLKEGRPHDNGIRNLHAKFRDGREIELITADRSGDELAAWYVEWLARHQGPALLALHAGPVKELVRQFAADGSAARVESTTLSFPPGHRWRHLFFAQLNASLTDRPEHFEHENGALTLEAVWLNGEPDVEMEMLARFGVERCGARVDLPGVGEAERIGLRAGELLVVPRAATRTPGRRIVGMTVRVADAESLVLDTDLRDRAIRGAVDGRRSVVLDLRDEVGAWLELRSGPESGGGAPG